MPRRRASRRKDPGAARRPARAKRPPRGTAAPRAASSRASAPPPTLSGYFARTRDPIVNLLFLAPWFLVYLLCWWSAGDAIETRAAAWLRTGLAALGPRGLLVLRLAAALGLCALVIVRLRDARKDAGVFPWMMAEGALFGVALFCVSAGLTYVFPVGRWIGLAAPIAGAGDVRAFGIAVGAGIFEEILFRGLLLYGTLRVLRGVVGADRITSAAVALVVSASLFSAYHHWGVGGEPWDAVRFTFRLHAGLYLGGVFLARGLGVAAFAHGFYDALVLLG